MKNKLNWIIAALQTVLYAVLDIIFPPRQPHCRLECFSLDEIRGMIPPAPPLTVAFSLFNYHHPFVREALWHLKYKGNKTIARTLSTLLYEEVLDYISEYTLWNYYSRILVIPIPISNERRRERGYNQCELLCEHIAVQECVEYAPHLLQKIRHTESQTKKSRYERLRNLRGCFAFSLDAKEKITGALVVLIDDVTTTGSTLDEASRIVAEAGAKDVVAFTIAHSPKPQLKKALFRVK